MKNFSDLAKMDLGYTLPKIEKSYGSISLTQETLGDQTAESWARQHLGPEGWAANGITSSKEIYYRVTIYNAALMQSPGVVWAKLAETWEPPFNWDALKAMFADIDTWDTKSKYYTLPSRFDSK